TRHDLTPKYRRKFYCRRASPTSDGPVPEFWKIPRLRGPYTVKPHEIPPLNYDTVERVSEGYCAATIAHCACRERVIRDRYRAAIRCPLLRVPRTRSARGGRSLVAQGIAANFARSHLP